MVQIVEIQSKEQILRFLSWMTEQSDFLELVRKIYKNHEENIDCYSIEQKKSYATKNELCIKNLPEYFQKTIFS